MEAFTRCCCSRRSLVIAGAVLVWFILAPEDLAAIMQPVKILGDAVSIGLAILVSTVIACWTAWSIYVQKHRAQD